MELRILAYADHTGRYETLIFSRTRDGWQIDAQRRRHTTRPDGSPWGRGSGRVGGHRGLDELLRTGRYRVPGGARPAAALLQLLWEGGGDEAMAQQRLQALFSS
ncbi:MAG TPA: hypothetical protein ENK18_03970 [Deltaproteobacteria bacterium]|nr:hypothetical protein [Deltaproteobacteria bacterium]